jgi:hypothetical protein
MPLTSFTNLHRAEDLEGKNDFMLALSNLATCVVVTGCKMTPALIPQHKRCERAAYTTGIPNALAEGAQCLEIAQPSCRWPLQTSALVLENTIEPSLVIVIIGGAL